MISDAVFNQGLVVDRLQGLLGLAQKAQPDAVKQAATAHRAVDALVATNNTKAGAAAQADQQVTVARAELRQALVAAYATGNYTTFVEKLSGDTRSVYAAVTVQQARDLLTTAKRGAADAHGDVNAGNANVATAQAAADAADRAVVAASHHVATLQQQLGVARQRLAALSARDRAISQKQAEAALSAAMQRRGIAALGPAPSLDQRVLVALNFALAQRGKPYEWGGNGPDSYDCSGLVQQAFIRAGVQLPRVASDQQLATIPVSATDARPGDLAFFGLPATHVGMYLGNGIMVDAPYTGTVVRLDPVWRQSLSGFGRVVWPD